MAESKPRDAIALLKDDHRKVEELFEDFEKARGDGRKERLAHEICLELSVHAAIEEEIFQGLKIPYQVIDTATGDLGGPAYRKFDLEAWMPGRGEFGEVTSASNCTDYQARRLGIRCKSPDKKGTQFVHTLNGTAVASTRAIIAILENNQQADGSIVVPEILRPWMGGVDIIRP